LSRCSTNAVLWMLVMAMCGHTGVAAAERLQDAVQTALRRNPEVLGAAANLRAANQGYTAASGGRLPTVDLRVGSGREETESLATRTATGSTRTLNRQEAGLTLRQNLYDGEQVRSEMDRQSFRIESTSARLVETGEQIAFRVTEIYLDALRDADLVRLSVDNVRRHEDVLEKTRWRFSSGVGQGADVEQASGRLALARSTLESARGNGEDTIARYQRIVGRQPKGLNMPDSPESRIPPTLAEAQQTARDNSHSLRAARAEVSVAQATIRTVRADLLPRLDIEVAANRNRDLDGIPGQNNDLSAMLVMRYNLFRGGTDQARVREARERETAAAENANNIIEFTDESVARSWAARATARNRLASLESHVKASEQVLESYRYQFELGRRSLLDLVNAESELFQSRAALTSGRIIMRSTEYRLLAAMGILVKSLGLSDELLKLGAADGEAGDNAAAHDKR
jgi:outer membrane protein, adhesin transport system